MKRNAIPIPFNQIILLNENIENENNTNINITDTNINNTNTKIKRITKVEQVPHCEQANMEEIITITSAPDVSINDNILSKHPLEQRPLQYEASHLYFHTSMEEEDITEWMHLEPPIRETTLAPLSLNQSIKNKENRENRLCERILLPLSSTKSMKKEENNMTTIRKLNTKINFLTCENIKLKKQIRDLKYRLRNTVRISKMPKNNKGKKRC